MRDRIVLKTISVSLLFDIGSMSGEEKALAMFALRGYINQVRLLSGLTKIQTTIQGLYQFQKRMRQMNFVETRSRLYTHFQVR
ncbi:MAG: hypothetical protein ACR9NN_10490 [Nostochopsis sp.]